MLYLYVFIFYFKYIYSYTKIIYLLLINTLIKPYDKNNKQHIIDKAHGIIAIIKNKGDISNNILSSSVQLHNDILSSVISVIFVYILLNLILGYFLIKG